MQAKKIVIGLIILLLGVAIGWWSNTVTVGKFNTINATCTVLNTAVEQHMLTPEQMLPLGQATLQKLSGTATGAIFQLNGQQLQAASSASNCSQFMVGMTPP